MQVCDEDVQLEEGRPWFSFFFFFLPKLLTYLEVSSNRKKMHNQLQDLGSRPCVPDEKFLMYLPT